MMHAKQTEEKKTISMKLTTPAAGQKLIFSMAIGRRKEEEEGIEYDMILPVK